MILNIYELIDPTRGAFPVVRQETSHFRHPERSEGSTSDLPRHRRPARRATRWRLSFVDRT